MSTQQPREGIRPPGDRPEPAAAAPVAPVASTPPAREKTAPPGPPTPRPRWQWQLVIFLWITSLLFLSLYEFLWTFFRLLFRGSGQ